MLNLNLLSCRNHSFSRQKGKLVVLFCSCYMWLWSRMVLKRSLIHKIRNYGLSMPKKHWVLSSCQTTADMWYTEKPVPCPLIGYCPTVMSSGLAYKKGNGLSCFKVLLRAERESPCMSGNKEEAQDRESVCVCVWVCAHMCMCACTCHTWNQKFIPQQKVEKKLLTNTFQWCCGFKIVWKMESLDWRRRQSLEVRKLTLQVWFMSILFMHSQCSHGCIQTYINTYINIHKYQHLLIVSHVF